MLEAYGLRHVFSRKLAIRVCTFLKNKDILIVAFMKKILLIACVAVLFISPNHSHADSDLFYPAIFLPNGDTSYAVATGDVNNDGKNEVAMTSSFRVGPDMFSSISVYSQNDSGWLEHPAVYWTNNKVIQPETIDVGDVNNDGKSDIVVGNKGLNIEIFLQNAAGSFDTSITYPTENSEQIQIGDINNDGLLDIVGIGWLVDSTGLSGGTNSVDVFLQNQSGTFDQPVTYTITNGGLMETLDLGDVNNDGFLDIIVISRWYLCTNIGVLIQNGVGKFEPPVYYKIDGAVTNTGLAVGDINSDGLEDVVVSYRGDQVQNIAVFHQNISGSLDPPIKYPSSYDPGAIEIADINHDGKQDIILTTSCSISIYLQGSDNTLMPASRYFIPCIGGFYDGDPNSIAVADINNDSYNDIVLAHRFDGLVVLYNRLGDARPNISVSPSSVNFGSVILGQIAEQLIGVYNTGTEKLSIKSIAINGSGKTHFVQTNSCSTIEPGHFCFIKATFLPVSEGLKEATLAVTSNDPETPILNVPFVAYAGLNLFYHWISIPTGSWAEAVAIADVNSDGRNDVVMTTSFYFDPSNDYTLFVFLQNASGNLDPPVKYPAGNGASIDIGDVNNDGKVDIVTTTWNGIGVLIQNSMGGLNPMITYLSNHSSDVNALRVRIGDFNNDGLLDVVSVDAGVRSHDVDIFFQNIFGSLNNPTTYSVEHGGYIDDDLDVGDMNNDGLTDIVVMNSNIEYPHIGILMQHPNGGFYPPVYSDFGIYKVLTTSMAVGDINNDALQDIAVTYGGNSPDSNVGTFYQNVGGYLDLPASYSSYDIPQPIVIADVNHDMKQDIIVAHDGWAAFGIYLQDGYGMLLPECRYPLPSHAYYRPEGLAVGDINSDGLNDVVLAAANYDLLVVYHRNGKTVELPFPKVAVSASSVDFGTVGINKTATRTISISSIGTAELDINAVHITGSAEFTLHEHCGGQSSCFVELSFTPITEGRTTAILYIFSNDAASPIKSIPLMGEGGYPTGIAVTSPNGHETWSAGTTQTISWRYKADISSFVKIELVKSGAVMRTIATRVKIGNNGRGSYTWKIPPTRIPGENFPGDEYKIRITSTANSTVTDTSDGGFIIIKPSITVTNPNGGEIWQRGAMQTISWTYLGNPGTPLKLKLLKGGKNVKTIATVPTGNDGNGSYNWLVPAKISSSTAYKISVTSSKQKSVTDISDSPFNINE